MDVTKPIFVLSSHGHHDHYNPEVFTLLENAGMQTVRAILSGDINIPKNVTTIGEGAFDGCKACRIKSDSGLLCTERSVLELEYWIVFVGILYFHLYYTRIFGKKYDLWQYQKNV